MFLVIEMAQAACDRHWRMETLPPPPSVVLAYFPKSIREFGENQAQRSAHAPPSNHPTKANFCRLSVKQCKLREVDSFKRSMKKHIGGEKRPITPLLHTLPD